MLIQKIVDLLPELAQLSSQDQEVIAEDIYADLVDAKFRRKLENGESMPAFEAAVREAKEQAARGETMMLDDWLAEEPSSKIAARIPLAFRHGEEAPPARRRTVLSSCLTSHTVCDTM